jgi:hypothetical protein
VSAEVKARNQQIEKELKRDQRSAAKEHKLLLLGRTPKSTTKKNLLDSIH